MRLSLSCSMNWDDFRLVKAIADSGSLGDAAQCLRLNHSTVFRRLGQIETNIGRPLFERSRSGYALTQEGEAMVALAHEMSNGVLQFERLIIGRDDRLRGDLRVTITDLAYAYLFAPIFAEFIKAYPDIHLEVNTSNIELNLSQREADVAIRSAVEPCDSLIGRRVAPVALGLYAKKQPKSDAAAPLRYIGFSSPLDSAEAGRWMEKNIKPEQISIRVSSMLAALQCAELGLGAVILPRMIGDSHDCLERLPQEIPANNALWLLTHVDIKNCARVRAFTDFVWNALARRRALIAGLTDERPCQPQS